MERASKRSVNSWRDTTLVVGVGISEGGSHACTGAQVLFYSKVQQAQQEGGPRVVVGQRQQQQQQEQQQQQRAAASARGLMGRDQTPKP